MAHVHSLSTMVTSAKGAFLDINGTPPARLSQDYLTGLRGILAVESFIWLWIQTFVPAVASDTAPGPLYQTVLRKALSVLFCDQSLIFSFFIILSARTCCIHFLDDPSGSVYARSLITRPLRIGISLSVALGISLAIFSNIDTSYVDNAARLLQNPTLEAPSKPATSLAAFNSIYDLLWVVRDFFEQQGNQAWPSKTMWAPSLIYLQSYTVYITMAVLPVTRPSWHLKGLFLFSLGSFWFASSWGWFSAAGLFIAEMSLNATLRARLTIGIKIRDNVTFPYWILAMVLLVVGLVLKYIWTAAFPQYADHVLVLHPSLDLSGNSDWRDFDTSSSYPRLDNYLVVVGTFLLVELSDRLKLLLSMDVFTFIGKRSLSFFAAQSLLVYTVGLKLFLQLHAVQHVSVAGSNAVVLIVLAPTVILAAEVFYRAVDQPATWIATYFYQFMTRD